MTTEFKPRPSGAYNDHRDWYDQTLDHLQDLCGPTAYPFATTDGERAAATYVGTAALTRFIFTFEPALADLSARDALDQAYALAHRRLTGTHPADLDYEANQHFGPPEIRTIWGPRADEALADSDIDSALAERYRLDHGQANQLRERMGLPTVPDPNPDLTRFTAGEDW